MSESNIVVDKAALVDFIAEATGFTKKDVKVVLESQAEAVRQALANADVSIVKLTGIGTIKKNTKPAGVIKKSDTLSIPFPACITLSFKSSSKLKEAAV